MLALIIIFFYINLSSPPNKKIMSAYTKLERYLSTLGLALIQMVLKTPRAQETCCQDLDHSIRPQ